MLAHAQGSPLNQARARVEYRRRAGPAGAGASWEGFVTENLMAAAGERCTPYLYRTEDGAEIDMRSDRGGKPEIAIKIKRSSAPTLSAASIEHPIRSGWKKAISFTAARTPGQRATASPHRSRKVDPKAHEVVAVNANVWSSGSMACSRAR
jgi:hypothetical protein